MIQPNHHATRRMGLVLGTIFLIVCGAVARGRASDPDRTPAVRPTRPPMRAVLMAQEKRFHLPDDALDGGRDWLNVRSPIHLSDLRGKIVLFDFWTYCCINCHHILPDLARLEQKYANQLVVIGVHTAKFEAERDTDNIRKKVNEYGIKHPVINDGDQVLWNKFQVTSWPTLILVDPNGDFAGRAAGEGHYEELDRAIGQLVKEHRALGDLNETPLKFEPEDEKTHDSPLRYPGKVLADAAGKRLFISDTADNRIVITDLAGKFVATVGNGAPGRKDGAFADAQFHRPQGMCLVGDVLYVADTENHLIRAINLASKTVETVAGTGVQAPFRSRGGPIKTAAISSPWDILAAPGNPGVFYIAMAGTHQIWKLDLKAKSVTAWAGSGDENIMDGTRESAQFAQPSGLATDGHWLYVADSEVSGVRQILLADGRVETIVGVGLFGFGDRDGKGSQVRLQHCLGLTYGDGTLYIADTYNNKIKVCDPKSHTVETLVGSTHGGFSDTAALFDEPGGLSLAGNTLYVADTNNHAIRTVDLKTRAVKTLKLEGISAPKPPRRPPSFPNATVVKVEPATVKPGESVELTVALTLPEGYKVNPDAPMPYLVETPGKTDVLGSEVSPTGGRIQPPAASFPIAVPLARAATAGSTLLLKVSLSAFLCQETLCEVHSYVWEIPILFDEGGDESVHLTNPPEKQK